MRTVAFGLSLACLVASPVLAGPFDGRYRPLGSGWDCQTLGSDGGMLEIRDDVFYGVESACTLTNPTEVEGMSGLLYDAECNGEGNSYSYRMMLMLVPEGLAVIEDGWVNVLERCE